MNGNFLKYLKIFKWWEMLEYSMNDEKVTNKWQKTITMLFGNLTENFQKIVYKMLRNSWEILYNILRIKKCL